MATTSSKAADNLLRAAQVPAPMFDSLKAHFDQSAQVMGAGWHGPTDIQTLSGLEASFCGQRISSASAPSGFTFDLDKIGFQGTYKLTSGDRPRQRGRGVDSQLA